MSGFGNGSNSNGQFWFGTQGFLYKKNVGVSGLRSTKMVPGGGIHCNSSTNIYNKYTPGSGGVGASSISNRRAKNRHATVCNGNNCFPFYTRLGVKNLPYHMPSPFTSTPLTPTPPTTPQADDFIFTFENNNNLSESTIKNNIPIRNTGNSFTNIVTSIEVIGGANNTTKVTISYNYTDTKNTDGLIFYNASSRPNTFFANSNVIITQFGNIPLYTAGNQFRGMTQLTFTATDTPQILPFTSLLNCFFNCTYFNSYISNWITTNVTNMENMFFQASSFNQTISYNPNNTNDITKQYWNTSNVIYMRNMFNGAAAFNNGDGGGVGNHKLGWLRNDNVDVWITRNDASPVVFRSGSILTAYNCVWSDDTLIGPP